MSEGGYEWRAFTQISKEAFKQQRSQLKNPQKRLDSYFVFDCSKIGEWPHDFNLKVKGRDALVPQFEFKYSPEGNPSQNIHKWVKLFETNIKTKVFKKAFHSNLKPFMDEVKAAMKRFENRGAQIAQLNNILSTASLITMADVKKTRSIIMQQNFKIEIAFIRVRYFQWSPSTNYFKQYDPEYFSSFCYEGGKYIRDQAATDIAQCEATANFFTPYSEFLNTLWEEVANDPKAGFKEYDAPPPPPQGEMDEIEKKLLKRKMESQQLPFWSTGGFKTEVKKQFRDVVMTKDKSVAENTLTNWSDGGIKNDLKKNFRDIVMTKDKSVAEDTLTNWSDGGIKNDLKKNFRDIVMTKDKSVAEDTLTNWSDGGIKNDLKKNFRDIVMTKDKSVAEDTLTNWSDGGIKNDLKKNFRDIVMTKDKSVAEDTLTNWSDGGIKNDLKKNFRDVVMTKDKSVAEDTLTNWSDGGIKNDLKKNFRDVVMTKEKSVAPDTISNWSEGGLKTTSHEKKFRDVIKTADVSVSGEIPSQQLIPSKIESKRSISKEVNKLGTVVDSSPQSVQKSTSPVPQDPQPEPEPEPEPEPQPEPEQIQAVPEPQPAEPQPAEPQATEPYQVTDEEIEALEQMLERGEITQEQFEAQLAEWGLQIA